LSIFVSVKKKLNLKTTMKKLVLMLAFAGMVGSLSAAVKGDDKDKDKAKKECCKKDGKSCCKKGEGKACSGEKKEEKKAEEKK
jgi:hypothetical protein